MRPSICRIVIYRMPPGKIPAHGQCDHPAIVAGVNIDETVNLHVFPNLGEPFFVANVRHLPAENGSDVATWHWPPRIDSAPEKARAQ
jgi:hypothetical protein